MKREVVAGEGQHKYLAFFLDYIVGLADVQMLFVNCYIAVCGFFVIAAEKDAIASGIVFKLLFGRSIEITVLPDLYLSLQTAAVQLFVIVFLYRVYDKAVHSIRTNLALSINWFALVLLPKWLNLEWWCTIQFIVAACIICRSVKWLVLKLVVHYDLDTESYRKVKIINSYFAQEEVSNEI